MKTEITILCDNYVFSSRKLIGEHGLSIFIETENGNYLFDTAQGKGILNNSIILKKDLKSIKSLILSHGHYDHTMGILEVLKVKNPLEIIAHPEIFNKKYKVEKDKKPRFVGIPYKKEYIETLGAKFRFLKEFTEIDNGIFISGEVERKFNFEKVDSTMKILEENDKFIQDDFKDDFSMAIKTEKGLIVILGCAHAGICNILHHFIENTGIDKIYAIIGGTHLGFADEERFNLTVNELKKLNIEKLLVSHCTGPVASAKLLNIFKEKFIFACAGTVIND